MPAIPDLQYLSRILEPSRPMKPTYADHHQVKLLRVRPWHWILVYWTVKRCGFFETFRVVVES